MIWLFFVLAFSCVACTSSPTGPSTVFVNTAPSTQFVNHAPSFTQPIGTPGTYGPCAPNDPTRAVDCP